MLEEGKVGGCIKGELLLHEVEKKKDNNGGMGVFERNRFRQDESNPSSCAFRR